MTASKKKNRPPREVLHCGECSHVMIVGVKGAYCQNKHCPQHAVVFARESELSVA